MKKIALTQGLVALVDDEDYEELNRHKWHAWKQKGRNTYYALRNIGLLLGKRKTIRMHRLILGLNEEDKQDSDHKNGDGLDNRRANLRACTPNQNQHNRSPNKNATSRFKGVCWHKATKKWGAEIRVNGERTWLGLFDSETKAARAYDKAARELFGEFARSNFPVESLIDTKVV